VTEWRTAGPVKLPAHADHDLSADDRRS